jgi:hypothetical protein
MMGRSRKATFKFVKDRISKKINSWSSKCLSQAGKEVLIKSILQSVPPYVMSIFLIHGYTVDEIEKMLNAFSPLPCLVNMPGRCLLIQGL